jgi:tetratricopeptide (TPR) repeat protein
MNTKRFTFTTLALTALIGGVATAPVHAQPFAYALAGGGLSPDQQERADELYERARDLIENARFERAVVELDRLIPLKSNRTDAALYWKAYVLARLGQRPEALNTIADLTK